MASKTHSLDAEKQIQEKQEQQRLRSRCRSPTTSSITSDYSSQEGHFVFDDACSQTSCGTKKDAANEVITEKEACAISKDISNCKELAMELNLSHAEIKEIEDEKNGSNKNWEKAFAVLIKFMQKEGSDATKGRLALALDKAGRRDIAETLIGNAEFLGKTRGQKTFILLKEQASVHDNSELIWICEDKDGKLYQLKHLAGSVLEKYLKFKQSVQEQGSANGDLDKSVDWQQEMKDVQAKIRTIEESVKEFQNTFESQNVQRGEIEVGLQLDDEEEKSEKVHGLVVKLVRLAEAARHLQEPFVPKSQIFDLCNTLSAVGKDMEERVKMWLGMTDRDEEKLRLKKLHRRCLSIRKVMDEEIYFGSLKDLTNQMMRERTHLLSAPTQSTRVKFSDDSLTQRLNTMPKSEREMRELLEQTSPPKEPMEEEVWSTKL